MTIELCELFFATKKQTKIPGLTLEYFELFGLFRTFKLFAFTCHFFT